MHNLYKHLPKFPVWHIGDLLKNSLTTVYQDELHSGHVGILKVLMMFDPDLRVVPLAAWHLKSMRLTVIVVIEINSEESFINLFG